MNPNLTSNADGELDELMIAEYEANFGANSDLDDDPAPAIVDDNT